MVIKIYEDFLMEISKFLLASCVVDSSESGYGSGSKVLMTEK
jgi:hypothetical protein